MTIPVGPSAHSDPLAQPPVVPATPAVPPPATLERRSATPILDTDNVPAGTMVRVPTAAPTGTAGQAPVVAVNNVSRWTDPTFLAAAGGALLALANPVVTALQAKGPVDWKGLAASCILAIVAYLRTRSNSVTR